MTEWWTYSLTDFLMFSPSVYYRLFELENQRLWPYQLVSPLAGVAIMAMILRGNVRSQRAAIALVACAWLVCAWTYFRQGYSTIHTFGNAFAIVFAAQATAMLLHAWAGTWPTATIAPSVVERVGLALLVFAIFLQPLLCLALRRPLAQSESFAFMPDPTVLATIGAFIAISRIPAWLFAVPLAWSLYSCATLYTMGSASAIGPLVQAALAIVFGVWRWRLTRVALP